MRKEFTMTKEQCEKLLDACKPVPYMVFGGREPRSPQENANDAWCALGREMGFDGMTVKPVAGKGIANNEPAHVKEAKKQWKETASELPVGMTLSRKYDVNSSELADHLAGLKPGSVVSDKSFISTSTDPKVWSGNVQFKIQSSPGAKGVIAGGWSQFETEREVILGPSARMMIVKLESVPPASASGGVKHVVHAVLLPPE